MNEQSANYEFKDHDVISDHDQDTFAIVFRFKPAGFIVVSYLKSTEPVYAYSENGFIGREINGWSDFESMVVADLHYRSAVYQSGNYRYIATVDSTWKRFSDVLPFRQPFQQWPPEGSTSTEGWLETNWTQTSPYNIMCPMDLNAGSRSVAGCPATAMAQVVNYHRTLNQTRFDDNDDYFHSYGAGNQYWIDNDYQSRDFPCFDTLNQWLDTLEAIYQVNGVTTNEMKAALTFACGVAARQVYTSGVSGTFGLDQALMAYQRFGYSDAWMALPDDTLLNERIAENVKAGLVVHLGLLVSTGSGGHNVVVDGYNTNEFFHFNFGWGGPGNGWYTLPPTSAPYNLTIIEAAIIDIKSDIYTFNPSVEVKKTYPVLYPNPFTDYFVVTGIKRGSVIRIFDFSGHCLIETVAPENHVAISTASLPSGPYIYTIYDSGLSKACGKLEKY